MVHSVRFTCVLDTNVLVPLTVRDLLFWFAYHDLYTVKWSEHIFDEWDSVMQRHNVPEAERNKRMAKANAAFPDALVKNYAPLIDGLTLPDVKDRHVLAAAIKTNANLIVTNNLKDFPHDYLANYGLCAKSADDFLTDTIDLEPKIAVRAFKDMVLNRSDPAQDEFALLEHLRNAGLKDSANYLHSQI